MASRCSSSHRMPKSSPTALPIWITALVLGACKGVAPPSPEPAAIEAPPPATSPMGGLVKPAEGESSFDGVVTERLDAGRYSYLHLDRGDWIATTGDPAQVGERVQVQSFGSRENFESPRLGRRFDRVVFGIVRVTKGA
jgi:hypothetical protein